MPYVPLQTSSLVTHCSCKVRYQELESWFGWVTWPGKVLTLSRHQRADFREDGDACVHEGKRRKQKKMKAGCVSVRSLEIRDPKRCKRFYNPWRKCGWCFMAARVLLCVFQGALGGCLFILSIIKDKKLKTGRKTLKLLYNSSWTQCYGPIGLGRI